MALSSSGPLSSFATESRHGQHHGVTHHGAKRNPKSAKVTKIMRPKVPFGGQDAVSQTGVLPAPGPTGL